MIAYKNYLANVRYDANCKIFYGRILGMIDVVNFKGNTVSEVIAAFKDSVEDYLDYCYEMGVPPCSTNL